MIFKNDSLIRGLVSTKKADWSKCVKSNCPALSECQSKKISNIECYVDRERPLVQVTYHKQELGSFSPANRLQNLYARILARTRYKNQTHNTTTQEFLDNIAKHVSGDSTPDLAVSYCGLSSAFDEPTKDSSLILEVGRVAITSASRTNSVVTVESSFGSTDANTLVTTVSGVTSASVFDLTSVTGLQVGDSLQIILAGTSNRIETRKISNISTNTITVSEPFLTSPTIGDSAFQLFGRIHLVSAGSTTLNSGNSLSISKFIGNKTSTDTIEVTHTLKFVGN